MEELKEYFTTLDCSVQAVKNETNDYIEATADDDATTAVSSSVPTSKVNMEITSNTARYVANQSNLMARRMMSIPKFIDAPEGQQQ